VPIKTEHQQEISCLHRIRERLNKNKVALSNQSRGLLSEFGVVFPCGHKALLNGLNSVIDNAQYSQRLQDMVSEYNTTIERLKSIKKQLDECVDESESGKILLSIPGIGVMNASALLAAIDKGQAFNNPKEFAVWLGLTPKQHASGNIRKMGGITKRGDRYLRKQLIHGARALVSRAAKSTDPLSVWATKLRVTKPFNKVAVAHRLARLIWILLTRQERYRAASTSLEVSA
jgi:transposase